MRPQNIIRLATYLRKLRRYENPIGYRLSRKLLKSVFPKKVTRTFNAVVPYDKGFINVSTGNMHEYEILFHGSYEPAITSIIKCIVKEGDVCIDIGANIGSLSLIMAFAAGRKGLVLAVEPNPHIASRLQANFDLNRLDNCRIIQAAVSDEQGTTTLYVAQDDEFQQGKSSLRPVEGLGKEIKVDTMRGQDLFENIGSGTCTFIKIDAEGHDLIILRELSEIIKIHRPHIVFEYDKKSWMSRGCKADQAFVFLGQFGYTPYFIKSDIIFPFQGLLPDNCDIFCIPRRDHDERNDQYAHRHMSA
jgi:FkbM family methyltransferase